MKMGGYYHNAEKNVAVAGELFCEEVLFTVLQTTRQSPERDE